LKVAGKLLKKGYSLEDVSEVTEIPVDELKTLIE
jgi:hypothetical protein